jgi:hypothetical protein
MKDLAQQYRAELQATHNMRALVEEERGDCERDMADASAGMEARHNHELAKREAAFQARIMEALDKFTTLSGEYSALKEDWEARARAAAAAHEAAVARLVRGHEESVRLLRERLARAAAALALAERTGEERLAQGAEEAEGELEALRGEYKARIAGHRETALRCKSENGVMKKKYAEMQAALEGLRGERDRRAAHCEELRSLIAGLEQEIKVLQGIAADKDALMASKEERICAWGVGPGRARAHALLTLPPAHSTPPHLTPSSPPPPHPPPRPLPQQASRKSAPSWKSSSLCWTPRSAS